MQPLYKSFYALIPLALLSIHLSGSFVSSAPAPAPGPFQHEATVVDLVGRNTTVPPPETNEESSSIFPFPDETGVHGLIDDGRNVSFENPRTPQDEDQDDEGPDGEEDLPAGDDNDEEEDAPGGDEEETPRDDEEEEIPEGEDQVSGDDEDAPLPDVSPAPLPVPSAPVPEPSLSVGTPTAAEPIAGATTTVYIEDGYEGPGPEPSANADVDGVAAGVTVTVKVAQGWPEWDANADGRFDDVLRAPTAA